MIADLKGMQCLWCCATFLSVFKSDCSTDGLIHLWKILQSCRPYSLIKQLHLKVNTVNNGSYLWQIQNKAIPNNPVWDWVNCCVSWMYSIVCPAEWCWTDWQKDHCWYLWRLGSPWWRCILWKRSLQSWSFCSICSSLDRKISGESWSL